MQLARALGIRVGVVSRRPVVTRGLTAMLADHRPQVEVVEVADGEHPAVDVVLYDVHGLFRGDGSDLDVLVRASPVVLAVSSDLRPDLLRQALSRGVDGYLSIGASEGDLIEGIESAVEGVRAPVRDSTRASLRSAVAEVIGDGAGLSPREQQVLGLIALGMQNQEIAEELYLTENTIKTYVRSAYRKIGVTRRSEAVAWTIHHGYASRR